MFRLRDSFQVNKSDKLISPNDIDNNSSQHSYL